MVLNITRKNALLQVFLRVPFLFFAFMLKTDYKRMILNEY